ncbi:MAG: ATP-grasp domain-containing protein [Parvibaculaceae bacterium]
MDMGQWSASGASGALMGLETGSELGETDQPLGAIIFGGTHGSLSVARSLGRRGIPVWLIETGRGVAGFSRYVQKRLRWDGPDSAGAVDWLIDLADRHGLGRWLLYPAADPETHFVAANHERLSVRFRVNTMPWRILETAQDKSLLYKRAAELGLAYPKSYMPDAETGAGPSPERFPVVIKPAMRESDNPLTTAKAWRADDAQSYARLYNEARKYLPAEDIVVQEMIPGGGEVQFSYAALWHRGRPVASMVTRRTRQYAVVFGTGTFVETIDKPEIEDVAVRLLKSFAYHGLVEVEFKLDTRDGQYKVLDANTRTWAWIGLGEPAGVDFPWLAWRMEMGDVPELKRGRAGASWRHLPRDILAGLHEVRSGRMSAGALVDSLLRKSTGAVLAFDDPVPAFVDVPLVTPRLLRRVMRRLAG